MINIMIVDDEEEVAQLFAESLAQSGFRVSVYCDGSAALNSCVHSRYSLVIIDVNMPNIDGISLLQMIRAQRPGMPCILLSGRGVPRNNEIILEADAFVLKIDGPRKLLSSVIQVLARRGINAGSSQTDASI